MTKTELEKLVSQIHKEITRTKGKQYAPNSHEIQLLIDKKLKPNDQLHLQKI